MTVDPKRLELEEEEPRADEDAHEHGVVLHQLEIAEPTDAGDDLDDIILAGLVNP
jgi:hypothetical protein